MTKIMFRALVLAAAAALLISSGCNGYENADFASDASFVRGFYTHYSARLLRYDELCNIIYAKDRTSV